MIFEFDIKKSEANRAKHGIDFEDAKELWLDGNLVELDSRYVRERRSLATGLIGQKHYAAVVTYRHEAVRIISVRRSRKEEVTCYEKHIR